MQPKPSYTVTNAGIFVHMQYSADAESTTI